MSLLHTVVGIGFSTARYLAYAISLILIYNIALAIYNLVFHPLRRFPGPILHRASRLPWAIANIRGVKPHLYNDLHEQYGPVVRIAPDFLSFTDAKAWKDIYGHRAGADVVHHEMPKARVFYNATGQADNLVNATPAEHSRLRRALAYGFSAKALREQETMITRHVDHLMTRLREKCDGGRAALDMDNWFIWTTFDIIGELVFGQDFDSLRSGTHAKLFSLVLDTVAAISFMASLQYLGLGFVTTLLTMFGSVNEAYTTVLKDIGGRLKRRMASKEEKSDLIEGLIKIPEAELGFEKLQSNSMLITVAGSETTATLLTGAVYLLLKNPEKLAKLQEEIWGKFKDVGEINFMQVSTLEYLNAVISESLRYYPPVAGGSVRMVPGSGGQIAGHFVPGGTLVEINNWSANHYQGNWTDTWTFSPERFLVKKGESRDSFESSQPFSYGPRNCIGQNLAMAEIRLILARLIFLFDLKLGNVSENWMDRQLAHSLWLKPELPVYLIPRQG